jgi:preprotein translocase subunit SecY
MTGLMCQSCCSAELPNRLILRAKGVNTIFVLVVYFVALYITLYGVQPQICGTQFT